MSEPGSDLPGTLWAGITGGKDSIVAAHVLSKAGKLAGCFSLVTGIGDPENENRLREVCLSQGWKFEAYSTTESYDGIVRANGFPGPGAHRWMVTRLKGRALRQFKARHPGEWIATGVREKESQRRSLQAAEFSEWEGIKVWAPIFSWTTGRVWSYIRDNNLPIAPCFFSIGHPDCDCGAMAQEGEIARLEKCRPAVAARIHALEAQLDADNRVDPRYRRWGNREPGQMVGWKGQRSLDDEWLEANFCSSCSLGDSP